MNALLKRLSANPAVQTLLHRESGLGNLSATEEALLLAAAIRSGSADHDRREK